jgi:multiple sugar transport system substrate-binding protein
MNSLRPFEPGEIERLGGATAFSPAAWKNSLTNGVNQVWGIPSRVDVRVIYYWKDMLEAAGIDAQQAFSTADNMIATLARLKESGIEKPLVLLTDLPRNNVYYAASWVWGMGGEIVDADGNMAFLEPASQAGLTAFFNMQPYMATGAQQTDESFLSRQSAVMIAGQWMLEAVRSGSSVPASAGMIDRLGIALPPGPSFVGGTNLVIWQHENYQDVKTALELIQYLIGSPSYIRLCLNSFFLPARISALCNPLLANDPHYSVLVNALQTGRSHSSAHLWVLLAERLGSAISMILANLAENPNQNVAQLVARQTGLVASRLEQTMGR